MSNTGIIIWTTILGLLWFVLSIIPAPPCPYENLSFSQFFDPLTLCHAHAILFKYRAYPGIFLTLIFISINFYYLSVEGTKTKKTVNDFLRLFIQENLDGDIGINRITVFEATSCRGALFYFIRSTFMNLGHFINRKCLIYRLKCCPIMNQRYLVVYARVGNPNPNTRSTIYKIPTNNSEINGIVPLAAYNGGIVSVHTPKLDAEEIVEFKKITDINSRKLKKSVEKYMEKGAIKDFGRLKMIRRFSRNIWASTLFINANKGVSHVIVFDSNLDEPLFERENFLGKINDLSKNIHILLNNK